MAKLYTRPLTIVIPNWNHEFVLPRAIKSALAAVQCLRAQNVPADILVMDDGSRDGSPTLLRQLEALYCEQGLQVSLAHTNHGVVAVRNRALAMVSAPYIVFMDADNQVVPENLFHFYRAIADTQATVVYGNLAHQGPYSGYLNLLSNESFQPQIFEQNYIDTFALYDRAALLDAGGFRQDPLMDGHEDWELYLHLAVNGQRIVFVPLMFGIYHEVSLSRVKTARASAAKKKRQQYIRRVFDQFNIRRAQTPRTQLLRYHPDIGYL